MNKGTLIINGIDYSNGGGSGANIDYSTEEQYTGKKWIDGKKIYQKSYSREGAISTSGTVIDTIDDLYELINVDLVTCGTQRDLWLSTSSSSNNYSMRVEYIIASHDIRLRTDSNWTNPKVNVTIYYTKVSD